MAAPADMVFEVRPTGGVNNGGGFSATLAGVSGLDYSQQDLPQLVVTDGVCTGNTTLTSATGGFTPQMQGNVLTLIFSGSFQGHWAVATYVSATQVTLDRNGPNHTAMTVTVGGASLISAGALPYINTGPFAVAGNKQWIQGPGALTGDYTATINDVTLSVAGTKHAPFVTEGYSVTRGDGGRPTILSGGTLDSLLVTANFNLVKNLHPMKASGNFRAVNVSGAYCEFQNCIFEGGTPVRIAQGSNTFRNCEIKSASSTNTGLVVVATGNTLIENCSIHGNGGFGVDPGTAAITHFRGCHIYANGTDGMNFQAGFTAGSIIENNVFWNNGRDNIRFDVTATEGPFMNMNIRKNIFGKAVGYDLNYTQTDATALPGMSSWAASLLDCNAFYTTGTGRYHFIPANTGDLVLTASPFASDTDFTLNNTTGGGALIRANPCVSTLPDANVVYAYIGASAPQTATASTATALMRSLWRELVNERDSTVVPDSVVDVYLDFGCQELNRRFSYHRTTSTVDVTLVADTQEYDLPADALEIEWLQHNGVEIEKGEIDQWRRQGSDWRNEAAGFPRFWSHYANKLVIRPKPSGAAVAAASHPVFRYVSTPPSISDSGPEQLTSEEYRPAVLYGAYLWSMAYPDSAVAQLRAQGFMEAFEKAVQAAALAYAKRGISR